MHPRGLRILLFLLFVLLIASIASGEEECSPIAPCIDQGENQPAAMNTGSGSICIYFFYGQGCPHCARIEPLVEELVSKYPQVEIRRYEVYFNSSNQMVFKDFLSRYGVTVEGVPIIFIGDRALIGESSIRENLEPSILYFMEHEPVCPEDYNRIGGDGNSLSPGGKPALTVPVIVSAALVDSINPCAFAVLTVLLSYLVTLEDRRRMKVVGVAYILTVFAVYFVSGLGLLLFIQQLKLTKIVYIIAAIFAITAGGLNLYEAAGSKTKFTLSIPESKKALLKEYILKASIPAAIILGGLVSLFELPCTGGVYLAILGLIASRMSLAEGIPYLILYNTIFILPLLLILAVIYWGVSPASVETWRSGGRPIVRAIMGLAMLVLGVVMLLGFV